MNRAQRALITVLLSGPFLLLSRRALAQEKKDPSSGTPTAVIAPGTSELPSQPTHSPSPTPDREQAAVAAFEQAITLYAKGDLRGSLESMQVSYRLSARPKLLFNLARLERELQQCEVAKRDYALYLKDVPQGQYRGDAQQAVQELDRDCVPPAAAPKNLAPPGPPDQSKTTRHKSGWVALGAGALTSAVAIPLVIAALVKRHSLSQQAHVSASDNDAWRHDYYPGVVLGIAAAGFTATGAILLLLEPQVSNVNRANAQVYLQPGFVGAGYSRAF